MFFKGLLQMWMVLERMRRRVSDLLMPNKKGEQKQNINKSNMCVKVGKWGLLSVRSSSTTKIIFKLQIAMQRSNIQILRTRNLNLGVEPSSMTPQFRHYIIQLILCDLQISIQNQLKIYNKQECLKKWQTSYTNLILITLIYITLKNTTEMKFHQVHQN